MIISASRRTDIPAFFADWFFQRIEEGHVLVRNPMNPQQIARIDLSPEVIDGIVFWTKNPAPMLDRLDRLAAYPYYFHYTLTPYGKEVETNVPCKPREGINTMRRLSDRIGPDRVIWRIDPVLLSSRYTVEYTLSSFEKMANLLSGYVSTCTFGFIVPYKTTRRNAGVMDLLEVTPEDMHIIARGMKQIADAHGIKLTVCSETIDYSIYGIETAACVSRELLEKIGGYRLRVDKDKNQRDICRCVTSIDIGAYNTCQNGCRYCYANYIEETIDRNCALHDPALPLLIGRVQPGETVYERKVTSFIDPQMRLDMLEE